MKITRSIFTVMTAMFLIMGINVSAKTYTVKTERIPEYIVTAQYKADKLSAVGIAEVKDGNTEFDTEFTDFVTYLIFNDDIVKSEAVEKTEEIKPTEKPEVEKDYPDVYSKEKDANRAIMVVDSIYYIDDENGPCYSADVFFHGEKRNIKMSDMVEIGNVPIEYTSLANETPDQLKKGDVIWIEAAFSGEILKLHLLFRPTLKDTISYSNDFGVGFSKLFESETGTVGGVDGYKACTGLTGIAKSGYGYAYGAIIDNEGFGMTICDKSLNTMDIDIADGAVIYVCDTSEKFKITRGSLASVKKTFLPDSSFDEDGKLILLPEDANYKYAFARTVDGEATEILVFSDY